MSDHPKRKTMMLLTACALSGAALPLACSSSSGESIFGDDSSSTTDASFDASGLIDVGNRYDAAGVMGVVDSGPGYDDASDASDDANDDAGNADP